MTKTCQFFLQYYAFSFLLLLHMIKMYFTPVYNVKYTWIVLYISCIYTNYNWTSILFRLVIGASTPSSAWFYRCVEDRLFFLAVFCSLCWVVHVVVSLIHCPFHSQICISVVVPVDKQFCTIRLKKILCARKKNLLGIVSILFYQAQPP